VQRDLACNHIDDILGRHGDRDDEVAHDDHRGHDDDRGHGLDDGSCRERLS
jgi:hypothetical protein